MVRLCLSSAVQHAKRTFGALGGFPGPRESGPDGPEVGPAVFLRAQGLHGPENVVALLCLHPRPRIDCDLQGRKIIFTNSKSLVSRPTETLASRCPAPSPHPPPQKKKKKKKRERTKKKEKQEKHFLKKKKQLKTKMKTILKKSRKM